MERPGRIELHSQEELRIVLNGVATCAKNFTFGSLSEYRLKAHALSNHSRNGSVFGGWIGMVKMQCRRMVLWASAALQSAFELLKRQLNCRAPRSTRTASIGNFALPVGLIVGSAQLGMACPTLRSQAIKLPAFPGERINWEGLIASWAMSAHAQIIAWKARLGRPRTHLALGRMSERVSAGPSLATAGQSQPTPPLTGDIV